MATPTTAEIRRIRRLAIGDHTNDTLLPEDDITELWQTEGNGSVLLTAALCCDILAADAGATLFRFSADGASFDKTMQAEELRKRAAALRRDYYSGLTSGSGSMAYALAGVDAGDEWSV